MRVSQETVDRLKSYWNERLHDLAIVRHPVGTPEFFEDLWEYHFDKQRHLSKVLHYATYKDKQVLDLGCGMGTDALRFAQEGAFVTGVDISERAIELAKRNFSLHGRKARLMVMDGRRLEFDDNTFDAVYAHGILPYTDDDCGMVREIHRVLKPGGEAFLQAYNRHSWLYVLRKVTNAKLEHEKAPFFHIHTVNEMKDMTRMFRNTQIITERFPVKTRLHTGLKGALYNAFFVKTFSLIPRPLVRRLGWHVIARAYK
jgi:ubiquinone/menaquinone biosynthesis C-methylase UbiE